MSKVNSETPYIVRAGEFEGPLDVLLTLIEKRKLFINDISLGKVTDEYIAHIQQFQDYPMEEIANFIVIASTLVLIKSRSILPTLVLSQEEEEDIASLKERLRLHEIFRSIAPIIGAHMGKQRLFAKSAPEPERIVFAPTPALTTERILESLHKLLTELPVVAPLPKAKVRRVVSLEERMGQLRTRITRVLKMNFSEFARVGRGRTEPLTSEERVGIVVSFLAVLELFKQGIISVEQETPYGDIEIETLRFETPSYQ